MGLSNLLFLYFLSIYLSVSQTSFPALSTHRSAASLPLQAYAPSKMLSRPCLPHQRVFCPPGPHSGCVSELHIGYPAPPLDVSSLGHLACPTMIQLRAPQRWPMFAEWSDSTRYILQHLHMIQDQIQGRAWADEAAQLHCTFQRLTNWCDLCLLGRTGLIS